MDRFYSNGKILITGEYLVLDGATALALPTKFGQDLLVERVKVPELFWKSFSETGDCWFEAVFDLPTLRLKRSTFNSVNEPKTEFIAETLQSILLEAKRLNPSFLRSGHGFLVKTNLTFPRNWGLGSSSTLINNIAQWAAVDAHELLQNSFSGSGYDVASAQHNFPILYRLKNEDPVAIQADFFPRFSDQLFFVHLNKKQNSREGIAAYRSNGNDLKKEKQRISEISLAMVSVTLLSEFEQLLEEHEQIIASIIQLPPAKQALFSDYSGTVKSLGAWGGDFILATGNEHSQQYFREKGYPSVLKYAEMIL